MSSIFTDLPIKRAQSILGGMMGADKKDRKDEVVCEFFGIEITTKNPKVARILTSDVSKILNTEIVVTDRSKKRMPSDEDIPGGSDD